MSSRRRWLAKEVVQTSAMDCGPASLKCLLEGFGIRASYGRLREACQTDVDGTSIDKVEEAAVALGLDAEQVMVSTDHFTPDLFPALIVTRLPNGATHFLVVWRTIGPFLQLMDPSIGRRWVTARQFLDEVYVHTMGVPAGAWRAFAGSDGFLSPLRQKLRRLGLSRSEAGRLIDKALGDPEWRGIAALDAAARSTAGLIQARAIPAGKTARRLVECLAAEPEMIPGEDWPVEPGAGDGQLRMKGAVLVRVKGRLGKGQPEPASRELAAALQEKPGRPGLALLRMLSADGLLAPAILLAASALAAAGVVIEAVLLRGIFDLGRELGLSGQRLWAMAALCAFLGGLALLEIPVTYGLLRMGRRLELRLRLAFLRKIPRLGDPYFQSRLNSDMAERGHSVQLIRQVPEQGEHLLRSAFGLMFTAAAIAWIEPGGAWLAALAAVLAVMLPLAAQPALVERDLRVRSHLGGLSRFYLDALLGLVAIRAHGAERMVRREHESLLREWTQAGFRLQKAVVAVEAMQLAAGFGLAAWLLLDRLARGGDPAGVLLLAYWALSLPFLGAAVAQAAFQYPSTRNVALRLLEPLGAPEEPEPIIHTAAAAPPNTGVAIRFVSVSVRAAGHNILEGIDLEIEPGSHVAIVGPSGAGKSSLVGVLLGWRTPSEGRVLVDNAPLDAGPLREVTAWVDPAVQLWNRPLLENLCYGAPRGSNLPIDRALSGADLLRVLERMPEGLQTRLGEGGALVSGGEGQRVRLARAFLRNGVRLAILDEPARGLDRGARREMLHRARERWRGATLLCITHDVGETESFERVLVVDGGRIVEDGRPADLAARPDSRYQALLAAEQAVRTGLWESPEWRKLRLERGHLYEITPGRSVWEVSA